MDSSPKRIFFYFSLIHPLSYIWPFSFPFWNIFPFSSLLKHTTVSWFSFSVTTTPVSFAASFFSIWPLNARIFYNPIWNHHLLATYMLSSRWCQLFTSTMIHFLSHILPLLSRFMYPSAFLTSLLGHIRGIPNLTSSELNHSRPYQDVS